MSSKRILFKMAGSIAAYKAVQVLSDLVKEGHEIEVVASKSFLKFIGPATVEGITGKPLRLGMYDSGRAMDHINLDRWADLVILCPASAGSINRLAAGLANDLIGALFLAHDFSKPYLVAPAMNTFMYQHPATQASIKRLQSWGVEVLSTATGSLACGEYGEGRLLEPKEILQAIKARFKEVSDHSGKTNEPLGGTNLKHGGYRVLITAGGTRESIDGVRFITNMSTGRTGAEMADTLSGLGCEVTWLGAKGSIEPGTHVKKLNFTDFDSLKSLLEKSLRENSFDLLIHAAAISDYSVDLVRADGKAFSADSSHKMSSDAEHVQIELRKNVKLIDLVKKWSLNPNLKVVAFKLTATKDSGEILDAVKGLLSRPGVELVFHNDLTEVEPANRRLNMWRRGARDEVLREGVFRRPHEAAHALMRELSEAKGG